MSKGVANQIENLFKQFFWNEEQGKRRLHSINWDTICENKKARGLEVKVLLLISKALLSKWLWRNAHSRDNLWRKVISEKYRDTLGGWKTVRHSGSMGASLWPLISRVKDTFWCNVSFMVNSGVGSSFWKHNWLTQTSLQDKFPKLFRLYIKKEGTVSEFGSIAGQMSWNLGLGRNPLDHKISDLYQLLKLLDPVKPNELNDCLQWLPDNKGKFSVQNCYNTLWKQSKNQPARQGLRLPQKWIWDSRLQQG